MDVVCRGFTLHAVACRNLPWQSLNTEHNGPIGNHTICHHDQTLLAAESSEAGETDTNLEKQ